MYNSFLTLNEKKEISTVYCFKKKTHIDISQGCKMAQCMQVSKLFA